MEKKKAKTKKVVVGKEKEIWAGAKFLMGGTQSEREKKERNLVLLASKVLNVSPFGINILGNQPYLNKIGLWQKAKQYAKNTRFQYSWPKFSENDSDKAVCACKVLNGSIELTDWVYGECSPSSTKMSTLKGYQNHIAQTRARNRAIFEAFGIQIHEEMMANIAEYISKQKGEDKNVSSLGSLTSSSAEEVNEEKKNGEAKKESVNVNTEKLKVLAIQNGAKVGEEKERLEELTGHSVNLDDPTDKYLEMIEAQVLNKTVK